MKSFITLAMFIAAETLYSQSYFSTTIGKPFPYVEGVYGFTETIDSGFILPIIWQKYQSDTNRIQVCKLDKYGKVTWKRYYGNSLKYYQTTDAIIGYNGQPLVVGYEDDGDTVRAVVLQLTNDGDSIWQRRIQTDKICVLGEIIRSGGFTYGLCGLTERWDSTLLGGRDRQAYMVKLDSAGEILWQFTYGNDDYDQVLSGMVETPDSGFIAAGRIFIPGLDYVVNLLWLKVDKNGQLVWVKTDNTVPYWWREACTAIARTPDGNYMVAGGYGKQNPLVINDPLVSGGILMKINEDGEVLWKKHMIDVSGQTTYHDMLVLPDGTIVTTGENTYGDSQAALMKFTPDGELIWKRIYEFNPTKDERLDGLIATSDGGFCMGGQAFPLQTVGGSNATDAWVVKVDSLGCEMPFCIVETAEPPSGEKADIRIFPNPTHGQLTVEVPASGSFSFRVFNLLGEQLLAGQFIGPTVELDVQNLPPGPIFIQLIENGQIRAVGRAVILR